MMKLSKKSKPSRNYDWRPNFRDYDSLPDIRVVRTKFFVPALAIAIASALTVYIFFQEYRAMGISKDIQKLEEEIAMRQGEHDEKVELNAEFMKLSRKLSEVVEFKEGKLTASDLLLNLSSRLFDGMHLDRVEYAEGRADIQGRALVPAEEASRLVNDYLKSIEDSDVLQGLLDEYKLTSLDRDGKGNGFVFSIEVTKEGAGK